MKFCGEVGRGSGRNQLDFGGKWQFGFFPGSWVIFQDSLPLVDRV